jgi:hypothetical protein
VRIFAPLQNGGNGNGNGNGIGKVNGDDKSALMFMA